MAITLHSTDGQEIVVTADNIIGVVDCGDGVGVLRIGDVRYIQVTETYSELESFLGEISE